MKRFALTLALPLVALPAPAASACKCDFRVYNNIGYTIDELCMSQSQLDDWEPDLLGSGVFSVFDACSYDFRAVFPTAR